MITTNNRLMMASPFLLLLLCGCGRNPSPAVTQPCSERMGTMGCMVGAITTFMVLNRRIPKGLKDLAPIMKGTPAEDMPDPTHFYEWRLNPKKRFYSPDGPELSLLYGTACSPPANWSGHEGEFDAPPLDPRMWYTRQLTPCSGGFRCLQTDRNLADVIASIVWEDYFESEPPMYPQSIRALAGHDYYGVLKYCSNFRFTVKGNQIVVVSPHKRYIYPTSGPHCNEPIVREYPRK